MCDLADDGKIPSSSWRLWLRYNSAQECSLQSDDRLIEVLWQRTCVRLKQYREEHPEIPALDEPLQCDAQIVHSKSEGSVRALWLKSSRALRDFVDEHPVDARQVTGAAEAYADEPDYTMHQMGALLLILLLNVLVAWLTRGDISSLFLLNVMGGMGAALVDRVEIYMRKRDLLVAPPEAVAASKNA